MTETIAYKVVKYDGCPASPSFEKLVSPISGRYVYGTGAGTTYEGAHIQVFELDDHADVWACNHITSPEDEFIQIWRVRATNMVQDPDDFVYWPSSCTKIVFEECIKDYWEEERKEMDEWLEKEQRELEEELATGSYAQNNGVSRLEEE